MRALPLIFSLLGAILFALFGVSALLAGNWLALALSVIGLAVALPFPGRNAAAGLGRPAMRAILATLLAGGVVFAMLMHRPATIYRSDDVRSQFHAIYDAKMEGWPLPFEDRYLETEYGVVHVVVSGAADGPPVLLLHASGVSSWSWRANAAELGAHFRLYAIDTIGDAGRSEYRNLSHVLRSREDQAALYAGIMDQLGIEDTAIVVGASEGGFIASNLAVHRPDRVERLVLLGPMGYTGATGAVLRIMGAQYVPLEPIQNATFRWAFSDAPHVISEFEEWFRLLMSETLPVKVAPLPLPEAERQSIVAPTLFVFGTRDNLVGDPETARALVSDVPNGRVEIVDAGHLMAVENASAINAIILDFLARP